jgi:hypothetical protein
MFVEAANRSVANFASAGAVGHEANETGTNHADDFVGRSRVVLDEIDKRTVFICGECKKSTLIAGSTDTSEHAW